MKINLRKIMIYLYAFILIYMPNLSYYIKINSYILFLFPTFIYVFNYIISKNKKFFLILKKKTVSIFIFLNILFTAYFALRTAIAGTSLLDFYNLRILQNIFPIFMLIGVCIIYNELDEMNYNKKGKYKFVINVALIQSFIAINMVIIPEFRSIAYNIFYNGSNEINTYISASRLYGICDGDYTYSFQILHSYLALFAFAYAYFYKEKKYFLYSILILIVTILNGRFGLVIYLIGICSLFFYMIFIEKKVFRFIKYAVIIILSIMLGMIVLEKIVPSTHNVIIHAVNDVLSFVNEKDKTTETYGLINGLVFPDKISNKIFGSGYRLYSNGGFRFGDYRVSDVGFINDIFMSGIFSILLMYGSYLQIIKHLKLSYKDNPKNFEKFMSFILLFSVILANVKGEVFRSLMQIATILIITIFMLLGSENDEKKVFNNSSNI